MKYNSHLIHIEDSFLETGIEGLKESVRQLYAIVNILEGIETSYSLSCKWDGAPSIVCGVHPTTNKFFVGTKSVFNKTNPKICYNIADIYHYYPDSLNLAETLHLCLHMLKKLDIKTVLQGDLMYVNKNPYFSDLAGPKINGQQLIAFTPNTITYGVDYYSDLGNKIMGSKLGIIFHTQYDKNWNAFPNPNLSNLNYTKDVWFRDASYTIKEPIDFDINPFYLDDIKYCIDHDLNKSVVNKFSTNGRIKTLTNLFFNYIIRENIDLVDGKDVVMKLLSFIMEWYWNELDNVTKLETKLRKTDELNEIVHFLRKNVNEVIDLFNIWLTIINIKVSLLELLDVGGDKGIQPYFQGVPCSHEGFVLSDNDSGNLTKLVNRREFSLRNFNNRKWEE